MKLVQSCRINTKGKSILPFTKSRWNFRKEASASGMWWFGSTTARSCVIQRMISQSWLNWNEEKEKLKTFQKNSNDAFNWSVNGIRSSCVSDKTTIDRFKPSQYVERSEHMLVKTLYYCCTLWNNRSNGLYFINNDAKMFNAFDT